MPINSFADYPMSWRPKLKRGEEPLYLEIADALERDIQNGTLPSGTKLPPQRELADFLDVNLSTIARAFQRCRTKGLINGSIGKGTFVAAGGGRNRPMLEEIPPKGCIDLGASHPLYRENEIVARMLREMTRRLDIGQLLRYSDPVGTPAQLRHGAQWLQSWGVEAEEERILIVSGLQNGLAVILSSLFQHGDKILTDEVIYPGMKQLANCLGIELIAVPGGRDGWDWEAAEKLCRMERIKGVYLMPDCQNPTARTMRKEEREKAAVFLRKHDLICIEEGTYTAFSKAHQMPVYNLAKERTLYLATVSNVLCAGLRIAFLLAPEKWQRQLYQGIHAVNVMSSPIERELVSQLIACGSAARIVQEKRQELERRNMLLERLLPIEGGDGSSQFRWFPLPAGTDSDTVERELRERGVQVFGGMRFAVSSEKQITALRLAISTPETMEELEAGLLRLRSYLEEKGYC